jgi:rubrerythrin
MSSSVFQAAQVLDMAIQAESQGRKFYRACRDRIDQPDAAELFDFLIEQERKHERLFREMKERSDRIDLPESYAGEMRRYADSFVEKRIFKQPEEAARAVTGSEGPVEVIDLALGFERASVEFYQDMKKWIRPKEAETIDDIIDEEQSHIHRLNRLREKMEAESGA